MSRSQFSPRMRGCFSVVSPGFFCSPVLPAYAGMFPASVGKLSPTPSSPRVCGDVSLIFRATLRRPRFSPRMRGCFRSSIRPKNALKVLPAYAGMFLYSRRWGIHSKGSPRVCGDVSPAPHFLALAAPFSPRMRGCFRHKMSKKSSRKVLPAYAGMFPAAWLEHARAPRSPRVCGDVSQSRIVFPPLFRFSPRMRGCFRRVGADLCAV